MAEALPNDHFEQADPQYIQGIIDQYLNSKGSMMDASLFFHSPKLASELFRRLGVTMAVGENENPYCMENMMHGRMRHDVKRKRFECRDQDCRKTITEKKFGFTSNCHLKEDQLFGIIHSFVSGFNQTQAVYQTGVSYKTVHQWYTHCRDICMVVAYNDFAGEENKLGGENVIVEIDEHKQSKRHGNVGRVLRAQSEWIFGGKQRGDRRVFVVRTATRSAQSLVPLLRRFVRLGTIIKTDGWGAYLHLDQHGFRHTQEDVVIHNHEFVNHDHPETHTQGAERHWLDFDQNVNSHNPRNGMLDRAIAEHIYSYHHFGRGVDKQNIRERVVAILTDANRLYPGLRDDQPLVLPDFVYLNDNDPEHLFRWPVKPVIGYNILGEQYEPNHLNLPENWPEWDHEGMTPIIEQHVRDAIDNVAADVPDAADEIEI